MMEEYINYPNQIWLSIISKNLEIFSGVESLYDLLSLSNNLFIINIIII